MHRVLLPTLLLLLTAAPLRAEEPASAPDPAAAYAAHVAALPEPSAEMAFTFAGVMRMNGKRVGHAKISAAPLPVEGGATRWLVKDAMMIKIPARPLIKVASAEFDRHLAPLQGLVRSMGMGEAPIEWARTEAGLRATAVVKQGAVTSEEVRNFEFRGSALTTLAATVLFCRTALDGTGTFETHLLEIRDAMEGKPVSVPVRLEIEGIQKLGEHDVLAVKGTKGTETLSLLFDVKTRLPLALRLDDGERKLEILTGDEWSLPAKTAAQAALRAGYGLATGNVEILDDVTHWGTLYENTMNARSEEQKKEETPDIEGFRQGVHERWSKLPSNPPEMIKAALTGMAEQITYETLESGAVRATFPPMFKSLKVLLIEEGGIWYAIAFRAEN